MYTAGTTLPIFAACAAGFYGMLAFGEQRCINTISVINEGPHKGKLRINVSKTILVSKNIIVDIKDIHSVVAMGHDDLGDDDKDNNIIAVYQHIDEKTG